MPRYRMSLWSRRTFRCTPTSRSMRAGVRLGAHLPADVGSGKKVMVLSAGALLPRPELVELAKARGGQIIVPTGALLGLDAVTAAAEGRSIRSDDHAQAAARPAWRAYPSRRNGISVEGLNEAKRVFEGTAREAAAGFPANVNVAAALSLAGIGPDRT